MLVEWRNAVGCQLGLVQAKDERHAAQQLIDMLRDYGSVEVGDTFHILERDKE